MEWGKWSPAVEDADVRVDAHQSDIGDAFLLAEIVDFLTIGADAVEPDDIDRGVLARPGPGRTFPCLHDRVIAGVHGIVDGEAPLLGGIARATIQNRRSRPGLR